MIVKMVKTTICGTDLHILEGDVATCAPGRILGHEGVGTIVSLGAGVTTFHEGDPVLIPCISSCGKCEYCRRGNASLHSLRVRDDAAPLPNPAGWVLWRTWLLRMRCLIHSSHSAAVGTRLAVIWHIRFLLSLRLVVDQEDELFEVIAA